MGELTRQYAYSVASSRSRRVVSELLTSPEPRWDHFQGLRSDTSVSELLIPAAVKSASLFIRGSALPPVGQIWLFRPTDGRADPRIPWCQARS